MAEKDKTTVRRIKATDDKPKKVSSSKTAKAPKTTKKTSGTVKTKAQTNKKVVEKKQVTEKSKYKNPFVALIEYFKGAWYELKQVRWPTRSATWSMTIAVLGFTFILATLILLLDAGFNWLFELILK